MSKRTVHGEKGVYYGGHWLPIEECHKVFCNIENAGHETRIRPRSLPPAGCCSANSSHRECSASCKGECRTSRTDFVSSRSDGSYDVVVIGAGCIGACIARELSKTTASVLLIDAADDVTQGATKGNSGIVHAGYDDKPGSVRAKYCWPGNQMFEKLDKELRFGYEKNGSLVIATNDEEEKVLQDLYERGQKNGVKNLRIIDREELLQKEPEVDPNCVAALYSPDAGTLIPYEFTIALAENAADNGVEVRVRRKVVDIKKINDSGSKGFLIQAQHWEPEFALPTASGSSVSLVDRLITVAPILVSIGLWYILGGIWNTQSICVLLVGVLIAVVLGVLQGKKSGSSDEKQQGEMVTVEPSPGTKLSGRSFTEEIKTDYIVNCGGCFSDEIAAMVGDTSFKIKPRLGEYVLLHKREGGRVSHTLFPAPHPVLGKGVLVQGTLWGNLILGPTARDLLKFNAETNSYEPDKEVAEQSKDSIMKYILTKCKKLVPSFKASEVIHTFSGTRAKSTRGDWIIEPCPTAPGMIHAAAIDSPGIAGSPAIAVAVVDLLKQAGANVGDEKSDFNPNREPIIVPKNGWKGIKCGPPGKYTDMDVNVVCKCEKVTEREIVTACHRSLPIDSTQAIRKRTRAGMGHCQADPNNYGCEQRVAAIIAREKKLEQERIGTRPWPASSMLPRRWIDDNDRSAVDKLSQN